MTTDSTRGADDFTRIRGIGSAIQEALYKSGIVTFAQLAGLSEEEIAGHLRGMAVMSAERIVQEEWVDQARELAAENPPPVLQAGSEGNGQHYATFTVELLLEGNNAVRRTRITYVQAGIPDSWAGWDGDRLLRFLEEKAELRLPAEGGARPAPEVERATPEPEPASTAEAEAPAPEEEAPQLRNLAILPAGSSEPRTVIPKRQGYDIKLNIDLGAAAATTEGHLEYALIVYAKPLAGGARRNVGKAHGTAEPTRPLTVTIPGEALTDGAYRLEVELTLSSPATQLYEMIALLPGNLLHVF